MIFCSPFSPIQLLFEQDSKFYIYRSFHFKNDSLNTCWRTETTSYLILELHKWYHITSDFLILGFSSLAIMFLRFIYMLCCGADNSLALLMLVFCVTR